MVVIDSGIFDLKMKHNHDRCETIFLLIKSDELDAEIGRIDSWVYTSRNSLRTIILMAGDDNVQHLDAIRDLQLQ